MKYTIFGESHGTAIGVVLSDVPSGLILNMEQVATELKRRAPGGNPLSTPRNEKDKVEIMSGLFEGKTTGTPLCAMIFNGDTRSKDYQPNLPRPSHGDFSGNVRYACSNDYRGGGHFSGRLTAPLVFAGAVAKQILAKNHIYVGAHISNIHGIADGEFDFTTATKEDFEALAAKQFPTISDTQGEKMETEILKAKGQQDSVGGTITCMAIGVPAGFGAPDLGCNVEGVFAQHLFAVPAVKGVSFGAGFDLATLYGSQANDPFYMKGDTVKTKTNHAGGVNGGITNGMPLVCTVVMRPTPSISQEQDTVNMVTGENAKLVIHGRHDPCVVHRAVPVVEAACALAICEILGL
ncbi:MAG: chorismate synthase [Eubacteriales bacterium]